jgi:Holliday junction resolvase-like predicted endonuclease
MRINLRQKRGRWAEKLVEKRLEAYGFVCFYQHFRFQSVEWDRLFWKNNTVYAMEIRFRKVPGHSHIPTFPLKKRKRLWESAAILPVVIEREFPSLAFSRARFFCVEVRKSAKGILLRSREMVDGTW